MSNRVLIDPSILTDIADAIRSKAGGSASIAPSAMSAAIRSISGRESLSWHQCPEAVRNYLANVTYDPSDYTTSQIATYAPSTAVASNTQPIGETVDGATFYNEVPNEQTPFSTTNTAGTLEPLDRLRWIKCPQATNVRDLGGWSCDGGTVKYGMLIRGGEPTVSDKAVLVDECSVRFELNLRGRTEAQREITVFGDGVGYAVYDDYAWYSLANTTLWKQMLRTVFDCVACSTPIYFHCSAGADRTGTFACILEALLGVSQSDIDKDYELTSFATGTDTDAHARRRNESEWTNLITAINAFSGSTIRDKVVQFVATLGFTAAEINAFRATMIDGTPSTVTPSISTYTVTNTLTRASSSNSSATAAQYQPYTATLTPDSTCVFESVSVTMGGADVTAAAASKVYNANGQIASVGISIEDVTGNIGITAVASAETPAYTNLFNLETAQLNYRFNSSNAAYANNGYVLTDYIACDQSGGYKTLRVKGASISSSAKLVAYKADDSVVVAHMASVLNVVTDSAGVSSVKVGWYESTAGDASTDHEGSNSTQIRKIRLALYVKSSSVTAEDAANIIITLDEEIS